MSWKIMSYNATSLVSRPKRKLLEGLIDEWKPKQNVETVIVSLYIHCINDVQKLKIDLEMVKVEVDKYDRFIIGGDFNGHSQ